MSKSKRIRELELELDRLDKGYKYQVTQVERWQAKYFEENHKIAELEQQLRNARQIVKDIHFAISRAQKAEPSSYVTLKEEYDS